jgi:hypothetical protein
MLYTIKKGTEEAVCKRCKSPVYWTEQKRTDGGVGTMRLPIDTNTIGGAEPDSFSDGKGINHLKVCNANG